MQGTCAPLAVCSVSIGFSLGRKPLISSVRHRQTMKKEFQVIIEKDGEEFVMRCPAFPDAVVRAPTREQAMEKMKKVLTEKSKESGETEQK